MNLAQILATLVRPSVRLHNINNKVPRNAKHHHNLQILPSKSSNARYPIHHNSIISSPNQNLTVYGMLLTPARSPLFAQFLVLQKLTGLDQILPSKSSGPGAVSCPIHHNSTISSPNQNDRVHEMLLIPVRYPLSARLFGMTEID